jgi:hypothetical protein
MSKNSFCPKSTGAENICRIKANTTIDRDKTIISTEKKKALRFYVFRAVPMKNAVFWDVTPCGSCKNDIWEGRSVFIIKVTRIDELADSFPADDKGDTFLRNVGTNKSHTA